MGALQQWTRRIRRDRALRRVAHEMLVEQVHRLAVQNAGERGTGKSLRGLERAYRLSGAQPEHPGDARRWYREPGVDQSLLNYRDVDATVALVDRPFAVEGRLQQLVALETVVTQVVTVTDGPLDLEAVYEPAPHQHVDRRVADFAAAITAAGSRRG